ncbi:IclR family transcriptional regulator [Pseudonocardia zijingensis]|uniref:IclR family transcriptional regulator n=1 Tax=Pseudonocardia zijingensis TaxID=153376 RepID=A0ABP3ZNY1_9PSEU
MSTVEPRRSEHRTVTRTARILELVSAHPGELRLADLSERLGAPRSSVHVLVRGLVSVGYLVEADGRYSIGYTLGELVRPSEMGLTEMLLPRLEAIRDATGETVTLGLFAGEFVVYTASAPSRHSVRYVPELRTRRPLLPTSIGKLLLATWPEERLRKYLQAHGSGDVEADLATVAVVRADDRAFNRGETLASVTAVARPCHVDGRRIGGVSVGGPSERVLPRLDEIDRTLAEVIGGNVESALAWR